MSDPHDPIHAPEHHGLGPVKGGRLLVLVVAAVALVAVVAVWRACRGRGGPEAQAPTAAEGTVALGEAAQKQAGIATATVKRLTRSDRVEAPGVLALDEKRTARLGSLVEGMRRQGLRRGRRPRPARARCSPRLHSPVVHDAWADYRKAIAERRRRETELAFARQTEERAEAPPRREGDLAAGAAAGRGRPRGRATSSSTWRRPRCGAPRRRSSTTASRTRRTRRGESGEYIPVRSPLDGVVLEKSVTQGTAVTPRDAALRGERPDRALGGGRGRRDADPARDGGPPDRARASPRTRARPSPARITFVADMVNPKTRRVTVRCQVPNAGRRLKPEMYAHVTLGAGEPRDGAGRARGGDPGDRRQAPRLRAGRREGAFERREVALGAEAEGLVEVRSGRAGGRAVATTGSFLLKSELLKGSLAGEE